jgi:hypothetical protein
VNNHRLRVADGWSSDDKASRLYDLLDGELLPRLERPGCYLGINAERIVDAPTAATRTVILWPNEPETFRRPNALGPLDEALQQRWGCAVDYATVPTVGLRDSLSKFQAPHFSCPAWRPLSEYDLWLVWVEEPAQILGLLSIFESAAVSMHAKARRMGTGPSPRVLLAGPAAVDGFALARVYADALLPSADAPIVADSRAGFA